MESLRILSGQGRNVHTVKRSTAEVQHSQTVRSLFVMRSSCQAAKMTVKIFTPVAALTTACMGVSPPCIRKYHSVGVITVLIHIHIANELYIGTAAPKLTSSGSLWESVQC